MKPRAQMLYRRLFGEPSPSRCSSSLGRSTSQRRFGFTLIELLVVVSVIGVLGPLILPAVQRARCEGHRAASMSHVRQVIGAPPFNSGISAYLYQNGCLPEQIGLLDHPDYLEYYDVLIHDLHVQHVTDPPQVTSVFHDEYDSATYSYFYPPVMVGPFAARNP